MIRKRAADQRGKADFGWLDSRHTFSFGHYYDPGQMGFGPLRVINEDRVAPGGGFAPHAHANMEIVSYVLAGGLQHRDSLGTGSIIRPGDVQRMSAGSGIQHSEFNASQHEAVHFLQIWVQPSRLNIAPSYAQEHFTEAQRRDRLLRVVGGDGGDGALSWQQDASMYASLLSAGVTVTHPFASGRRGWLQVASGRVEVDGEVFSAGDGASIERMPSLSLRALDDAELLLFDLP